jgi:hypothetical protein
MGYFLSLSKSATSNWLKASEWMLLGFGLVLVVGIVGEIKAWMWGRWKKRFEYMVLIGVMGELLADGGIFLFSSRLQAISDREVADLNKEAVEARLQLAKLRGRMADRRLNKEQQAAISRELAEFHRRVQLELYNADGEIDELAKDIGGAIPVAINRCTTTAGFSGIQIVLTKDAMEADTTYANAIGRTFKNVQLEVVGPIREPDRGTWLCNGELLPSARLTVAIGRKP